MERLKFPVIDGSRHNQKSYNRLGNIINQGRLAEFIDWKAIEDRTRNLKNNNHWNDPGEIIHACANQFMLDHWARQEYRVEVLEQESKHKGILANIEENWETL